MEKTIFFVETGTQSSAVNKMLQQADLCDGAVIRNSSGYKVAIEWKEGEVVDAARIERTKQNLKMAFESFGLCVFNIKEQ